MKKCIIRLLLTRIILLRHKCKNLVLQEYIFMVLYYSCFRVNLKNIVIGKDISFYHRIKFNLGNMDY